MTTGSSSPSPPRPGRLGEVSFLLAVAALVVAAGAIWIAEEFPNTRSASTGPQGPSGAPGSNGTDGSQGAPGSIGTPGTNGTNGTYVAEVHVEWVSINFTDPAMGTNYSIPTPANFSFPIGSTTWVRFSLNLTNVTTIGGFSFAPAPPWEGLWRAHETVGGRVWVEIILGVPYETGSWPIEIIVSPGTTI